MWGTKVKTMRLSLYRNENGNWSTVLHERNKEWQFIVSGIERSKIDCIHSKCEEKNIITLMYMSDNDRVNTFIIRLCDNAYVIRVLKSTLSMHDRYNIYIYIYINTPTYVQCTIPNSSIKVYILICTLKESCLIYKTGSKPGTTSCPDCR